MEEETKLDKVKAFFGKMKESFKGLYETFDTFCTKVDEMLVKVRKCYLLFGAVVLVLLALIF